MKPEPRTTTSLIWTFQPEAQLIWDGVKANSATDATGTKYRQLGTDNVTLRVGARLHANYMNKGLGFIEGNWIHKYQRKPVFRWEATESTWTADATSVNSVWA